MRNSLLPLLLACCAVLSGCYELSEPVADKGAYAPVAGAFSCTGMSGAISETFTEQKSGLIFPDYRYKTSSDGSEFTFLSLGSNFFAAQIKFKNGRLVIAYIDAADDEKLLFLLPDLMSKGPYLEALARKNNVRMSASRSEPGNVQLVGTKADITTFIRSHDKGLLTVVATCTRSP